MHASYPQQHQHTLIYSITSINHIEPMIMVEEEILETSSPVVTTMIDTENDDEIILEIEYDSDGDELVEIVEEVYETDSEYEEEEIHDLPAVLEEEEEEEEDEADRQRDHRMSTSSLDQFASSMMFSSSSSSLLFNDESNQHPHHQSSPSFGFHHDNEKDDQQQQIDDDDDDDDDDKPAWARIRLKKTTMGRMLEQEGNLQAPITFTPFKNADFRNEICNPGRLKKTTLGQKVLNGEYISAPITHIPKNTTSKNKVVDPTTLRHTEEGELLKKGEYLSAPITHIREHTQKKKKKMKLVTRKVKKKSLDLDGEDAVRKAGERLARATVKDVTHPTPTTTATATSATEPPAVEAGC